MKKRLVFSMIFISILIISIFFIACDSKDVDKYVVKFEVNGGSSVADIENIEIGSNIIEPIEPLKENYIFKGWFRDVELEIKWLFDIDKVESDTILYAKWEDEIPELIEKYTVIFKTNGGSGILDIENIDSGSTILEPNSPLREGYVFKGWFKDIGLQIEWLFSVDIIEKDTILYAKWEEELEQENDEKYTVTFDSNGGSDILDIENIENGFTIVEPTMPVREGYIFKGWFKDVGLQEEWIFDIDKVEQNRTLYAKWEENSFESFTIQIKHDGLQNSYFKNWVFETVTILVTYDNGFIKEIEVSYDMLENFSTKDAGIFVAKINYIENEKKASCDFEYTVYDEDTIVNQRLSKVYNGEVVSVFDIINMSLDLKVSYEINLVIYVDMSYRIYNVNDILNAGKYKVEIKIISDKQDAIYFDIDYTIYQKELFLESNLIKKYDGNSNFKYSNQDVNEDNQITVKGLIAGDDVILNEMIGVIDDKNVGEQNITFENVEILGADINNYYVKNKYETKINILIRDIAINATVLDKVYDSTTIGCLDEITIIGLDGIDFDIEIDIIDVVFADKNVGQKNVIVYFDLNFKDEVSSNFSYNQNCVVSAEIKPKTILINETIIIVEEDYIIHYGSEIDVSKFKIDATFQICNDDEILLGIKNISSPTDIGEIFIEINLILDGMDSVNYKLDVDKVLKGIDVCKKSVILELIPKDKIYDGKTDVEIEYKLYGLLALDSEVMVSSINATVDFADVGENIKVNFDKNELKLIGKNSDKYILDIDNIICSGVNIKPYETVLKIESKTIQYKDELPVIKGYLQDLSPIMDKYQVPICSGTIVDYDGNVGEYQVVFDVDELSLSNYKIISVENGCLKVEKLIIKANTSHKINVIYGSIIDVNSVEVLNILDNIILMKLDFSIIEETSSIVDIDYNNEKNTFYFDNFIGENTIKLHLKVLDNNYSLENNYIEVQVNVEKAIVEIDMSKMQIAGYQNGEQFIEKIFNINLLGMLKKDNYTPLSVLKIDVDGVSVVLEMSEDAPYKFYEDTVSLGLDKFEIFSENAKCIKWFNDDIYFNDDKIILYTTSIIGQFTVLYKDDSEVIVSDEKIIRIVLNIESNKYIFNMLSGEQIPLKRFESDEYILELFFDSDFNSIFSDKNILTDITLYGRYAYNYYNIVYQGDENSGNITKYYINSQEKIVLKEPAKNGYEFKGWYFGDIQITEISSNFLELHQIEGNNIVLVAKWNDIESIKIINYKEVYYIGENFDYADLSIELTYFNGVIEILTGEEIISKAIDVTLVSDINTAIVGKYYISLNIKFKNNNYITDDVLILVVEKSINDVIESIEIIDFKNRYVIGEIINYDNYIVRIVYSDSVCEEMDINTFKNRTGVVISHQGDIDLNTIGEYEIKLMFDFGNYSCFSQNILINIVGVDSIFVAESTISYYELNVEIDYSLWVLQIKYTDFVEQTFTVEELVGFGIGIELFNKINTSKLGNYKTKLTVDFYGNIFYSNDIQVKILSKGEVEKVYISSYIETLFKGEAFNYKDWTVTIKYDTGYEESLILKDSSYKMYFVGEINTSKVGSSSVGLKITIDGMAHFTDNIEIFVVEIISFNIFKNEINIKKGDVNFYDKIFITLRYSNGYTDIIRVADLMERGILFDIDGLDVNSLGHYDVQIVANMFGNIIESEFFGIIVLEN